MLEWFLIIQAIKGRTAIRILNRFKKLKQKPYWGNHFWSRGYCVDTVGLDGEMIRKYVKYQEENESAMREMGDEILKNIAIELTKKLRNSVSVD